MTIAFPRSVFHDLGERFDEELDTTEDWDFLLRAVTLVGVANSEEHTAIYRWWVGGESSHHVHDDAHWQRNHDLVQRRMDQRVMLMPHGTVQRLQELVELPRVVLGQAEAERDRLAARVERLEAKLAKTRKQLRRQRRLNRRLTSDQPVAQERRGVAGARGYAQGAHTRSQSTSMVLSAGFEGILRAEPNVASAIVIGGTKLLTGELRTVSPSILKMNRSGVHSTE